MASSNKFHILLLLQSFCILCFVKQLNSHQSQLLGHLCLQCLLSHQLKGIGNHTDAVQFVLIKQKCLMLIAGQSVTYSTVVSSITLPFIFAAPWLEHSSVLSLLFRSDPGFIERISRIKGCMINAASC